ncbi:MAG: colanic acid biosynthesis glycosyltransferase WcaL [Rhodospirillales bacterium CG15_BIG_FIL_POST_REV_8_21_14_020_66_15]|nr:MAG: colanic acid biosynthesis glycosyltransferase WcaL [Rhodospirillales bacterium CG15_BIG_FIL_POST_REV_8_21_14_020_66_15]
MNRPLSFAVFAHEFPALSETFVLNQITGLLDTGHQVTIFAEGPRGDSVVHPDVHAYSLIDRTRYSAVPDSHARRCASGLRILARLLRTRRGALAQSVNVARFGRLAASLRLVHWADCLSSDADFDIILAHFGPVGGLAQRLRDAKLISGRLVTVMHGVDMTRHLRDAPAAYEDLFRSGDLFLPVAEVWERRLVELGCDPEKIAVHHMGVDTAAIPFRARSLPGDRPLSILSVGRLIEKKGIADALRAVSILVRRGVDLRYTVVGDGPLRPQLTQLCDELSLSRAVSFVGWRDRNAVAGLMERADILLAPSITAADGDQEGIPVTLMEAMAAGQIVVSTAHSGIPELVMNGRSGLLVEEGDPDGLAAAVMFLLSMGNAWPRISLAARRKVVEEFDIRTLNRRLVARMYRLLGMRDAPAEVPERRPSALPVIPA